MSLLVETIRVENGIPLNINFHNERMIRSLCELYDLRKEIDLIHYINVPDSAINGIFKCRVEYDSEIRRVEFIPYIMKRVRSLRLIEENNIDYKYKFIDRSAIDSLMERRGDCDDIIIIKIGYLTDSSYANLVFLNNSGQWVTPSTCLLPGTRRASLLKEGLIQESQISPDDLNTFSEVRLINALIGIDDTEGISVSNIKW